MAQFNFDIRHICHFKRQSFCCDQSEVKSKLPTNRLKSVGAMGRTDFPVKKTALPKSCAMQLLKINPAWHVLSTTWKSNTWSYVFPTKKTPYKPHSFCNQRRKRRTGRKTYYSQPNIKRGVARNHNGRIKRRTGKFWKKYSITPKIKRKKKCDS